MTVNFDILRSEFMGVLKQSFKDDNVELLEHKTKSFNKTENDVKGPLDQVFRDLLLQLLEEEVSVEALQEYVNFCIATCRKHLISPTMPVVLLGDIFDTLTLEVCEDMFGFVEKNVHVWKEDLFFTACKNNLLRLCNDLLRRLSRTTATVFCGKILLFLAKFFPFSERSGLNIVSEFNLENITEYGVDAADDVVTEIQSGDQKHVIDFTFYCKFWQLQDFFRNPNQCYDKAQWKLFCSHSTTILNTFQGIKLDYIADDQNSSVGYFAKYLTSQKLLDLQLHDVIFRRSVLLQFLIVFQYLTSQVKFKSDSFELTEDQKLWIRKYTENVYNLLKETPPDGEQFAKIISSIMGREELWNLWKNEGCPEMKKVTSEIEPKTQNSAPKELGQLIKEANEKGEFYMGSGELTKLWNLCPDNLEACKDRSRNFLPSLDEFFGDAIAQLDTAKPDEKLFKDSNFGWRALRLLSTCPHFFTYSNTTQTSGAYLETMVRRIAHERVGRNGDVSSQEQSQDNEIDEHITVDEQNTEELKNNETEEFGEDSNNRRSNPTAVTEQQLVAIVEKVEPSWEKLATKFGYKADEIEWFKNENPQRTDQAGHLLQLWFEDDEDASLENLLYILEGLEMHEAAEVVKSFISGNNDA